MSMSAKYHAKLWAEGKSDADVAARIAALRSAPKWHGVEFDDDRVRHMHQTEIETLSALLAERSATREAVVNSTRLSDDFGHGGYVAPGS